MVIQGIELPFWGRMDCPCPDCGTEALWFHWSCGWVTLFCLACLYGAPEPLWLDEQRQGYRSPECPWSKVTIRA